MTLFRIVDLRKSAASQDIQVEANSPEDAAALILGMHVFRGGTAGNVVCRVYWQSRDSLNMVRLYRSSNQRKR